MTIIKRGDTGIGLEAKLSNIKGNVNLTDADVLFLFRGYKITPVVVDAKNGKLWVVFNEIHTDKTGFFNGEFEVDFKDGRNETFPSDGYIKIQIKKDLRKK